MSVISEKVRRAIYARLTEAGDGISVGGGTVLVGGDTPDAQNPVAAAGCTGVYFNLAPQEAVSPFIVFSRVPKEISRALANNLAYESDLWLIKALVEEDASSQYSAPTLAEMILAAADAALEDNLSVSGGGDTVVQAQRFSEIPPYAEKTNDTVIYHHGVYYKVTVSK